MLNIAFYKVVGGKMIKNLSKRIFQTIFCSYALLFPCVAVHFPNG